jgi:ABC-type uncharacterized transport system fused permease/ATPase subunit
MYTYILSQDRSGFRKAVAYFAAEAIAMAVLIAIKLYFAERASIIMRRRIDNFIHDEYLFQNSFYDLLIHDTQIDNPDSRIAQNVLDFAAGFCVYVYPKLIQVPCIIIWYTYRVSTFLDWRMTLMCYAFGILSVATVRLLMHPVVRKNYVYQARNSDFRLTHVELKEGAEVVALSQGQRSELQLLSVQLEKTLAAQRVLANWKAPMNIGINLFAYCGGILGYTGIMLFLEDHTEMVDPIVISSFTSKASFYMIMLVWGFTQFFELLLNKDLNISDLCAYATRIMELVRVLHEHKACVLENCHQGDIISMDHVTIQCPNAQILVKNMSFSLSFGQSMFISGPSGIGKSSIFRVLGQLWPGIGGIVTTPVMTPDSLLVLTQDPYVPLLPQRECLAFPRDLGNVRQSVLDEIVEFLEIGHLMLRPADEWQVGLSPGERQRVALARVLLHQPRFVLLDEATSAIPGVMESAFYERLMGLRVSVISISHNCELRRFHMFSLDIDGVGRYRVYRNDE